MAIDPKQISERAKALKQTAETMAGLAEDLIARQIVAGAKAPSDPTVEQARDRLVAGWTAVTDAYGHLATSLGELPGLSVAVGDRGGIPGTAGAPPTETRRAFADFLVTVGESLVEAQERLDARSRDYLSQARPGVPILPTLFRIPKLAADMKFEVDTTKTKGLNLIFVSNKDQTTQRNQQSINFEIVAVPPPPEVLRELARLPLQLELLLDPTRRAALFALATQTWEALGQPAKLEGDALLEEEIRDEVLIVRPPPVPGDESDAAPSASYLLVRADEAKEHLLGAWHLAVTGSGDEVKASLELVYSYRLKPAQAEDISSFKEAVLALASRQKQLLGWLRGAGGALPGAAPSTPADG